MAEGSGESGGAAPPAQDVPIVGRTGANGSIDRAVAVSIHVSALVLVSAALYFGKEFFLPIVLGFLGALTLVPVVRWLQRHRVPAGLSALGLVLILGGALAAGGYALSGPVAEWVERAPSIGRQVEAKLRALRGSVSALTRAGDKVEELAGVARDPRVQEVVVRDPGFLSAATSSLGTGLGRMGVALILVLFLLASGDMVYEKILRVLPTLSDKKMALRIVHDIETSISRYLLTITLINIGLGICIAGAMWAIGMPSPALWGVAATLLNFLPYIGAILGVALTAVVGFISIEPLGLALLAPLAYAGLTLIEGNIVTPLILGRRLELNTVALFIGVTFWGWVWGLAGVLIAVPLMVVLKTLCDHLPAWSRLGEFLSLQTPKSDVEKAEKEPDLNPIVKT